MNIYKKILNWFQSASLNRKIIILVFAVGILPLGLAFWFSLSEMGKITQEQQSYTENQGFTQVFGAVEDKLERMKNIAALLAMDDDVTRDIMLAGQARSTAEQLAHFNHLSRYLNSMELAFKPNDIVFFVDSDLAETGNQAGRFRSMDALLQTGWYDRLRGNNGNSTWVRFQEPHSNTHDIAIVREIWNPDDYHETLGVLAVVLAQDDLKKMLVPSARTQMMYLETADGIVLTSNTGEEDLTCVPLGKRGLQDRDFSPIRLEDTEYLLRSQMMEGTSIYLVSLVPEDALEREVGAVNARLRMTYALICLVSLLAVIPLTRSITRRIFLLKEQMMRTQDGIISKLEGQEAYHDEIGQLTSHYNDMVDKIGELLQEQYALGQQKTEAELRALQSQINPHFLYNTLDMINWMALKDETDNIQNVVLAMSKFYRLTMSKGHDIVTIGDELTMCSAYMEIQNRRYRGKILYEVEVDDEIEGYLIPKITLQPFLENAIIHGINEKEDAMGNVRLNGWMEDGRITLSVTDDGAGMREEDKTKPHTGSHYGMENIAQRLELFFGEKIPIRVESSPGIGTCIIINIPAKAAGGQEGVSK